MTQRYLELIAVIRDGDGNPTEPARSEALPIPTTCTLGADALVLAGLSAISALLEGRGTPAPFLLRAKLIGRALQTSPEVQRALRITSLALARGAAKLAGVANHASGPTTPTPTARMPAAAVDDPDPRSARLAWIPFSNPDQIMTPGPTGDVPWLPPSDR